VEDWFETYAAALEERLREPEPTLRLPRALENPILALARVVAHGTERKNAPLAAYVAARYVAARGAQGVDERAAMKEAVEIARSLIPADEG
jgi:hypothetical protein